MKQFWNIVIGSFVGVWIALLLFSVLSFFMSFAFMGTLSMLGKSSVTEITDNSILKLDLGRTVDERASEDDFVSTLLNDSPAPTGLDEILHAIETAKQDSRISGIYIECNGISAGTASLYEIRKALADFKKESGKFIYAYGDNMSQADYYLASAADSIFINTIGSLDLRGLAVSVPFFKKALDKIGVEMQIVRVGTFKSAVEPYILTEMSNANRLQYSTFVNNIWGNMTETMSLSRQITPERINEMTDSIVFLQTPEYLVANKLIDGTCYKHEIENKLKKTIGIDNDDDINFLSVKDLSQELDYNGNGKEIAVIYAVGEIYDGGDEGINSESLSKTILEIADNDNIAGVVLRVNSPGGSAYGSEQIWNALQQIKKAGKPLAVSMGDMAASGGYYISCGADRIFAEPLTLTGSIGVFGMIPCFQELLEDKIGITQSVVKTNSNSEFPMITEKMTPSQAAAMQRMVNNTYELFVKRCAEGRNITTDSIKMIAEGRVWDGISAKDIGLIDEFGNLNDAINWVAEKANVQDYSISVAPEMDDFFTKYISKYMNHKINVKMEKELGMLYHYNKELQRILKRGHILCLAPEVVTVN